MPGEGPGERRPWPGPQNLAIIFSANGRTRSMGVRSFGLITSITANSGGFAAVQVVLSLCPADGPPGAMAMQRMAPNFLTSTVAPALFLIAILSCSLLP